MSDIDYSLSPKEFIAEVRASYIVDDPRAARLHKSMNNALELLSLQLYSDSTHFVLELIQNADDNEYVAGIVPRLSFILKPNRLIVINNEIGLSAKNVNALCDIGASTKVGNANQTGEKGIGFKSVFSVSDTPEVHSNGFHFRFNRNDEKNLLGFVVPEWVDESTDAVEGQTTLVLAAPKNSTFDSQKLNSLELNLLLFLRKLRHIEIREIDGARSFHRADEDGVSILNISNSRSGEEPQIEQKSYLRTEYDVDMTSVSEDARPGIKNTKIVLALPIDETFSAAPDIEGSKIYAFLPVRQAGFKFSIQADFVLTASREEIREGLIWNIRLRDSIASAFVQALDEFKKRTALGNSYLEFIPRKDEISGAYLRPVRKAIIDRLVNIECLRSESGNWRLPKELRTTGKRFRELFPSETAKHLFGYEYIHEDQIVDKEILDDLGVQGVLIADVVSLFTHHLSWFQEQPNEWKKSLYALIADSYDRYVKAGLLDVPFLPLENGTMVAPKGQVVYFPLGKGKKYGFEQDLHILDIQHFDFDIEQSKKTVDFLTAIGVRNDEPYALIVGHIIPKHVNGDWKSVGEKSLLGHLRYIKDKCEEYLLGAARNSKSEVDAFKELTEKLFIGTKERRDGSWVFNKAEHLYVGDAYLPEFTIEKYLDGTLKAASFVSEEYLPKSTKNHEELTNSWRNFLSRLGIREAPKLISAGRDWICSPELTSLLNSTDVNVRLNTLLCISRHWNLYADKIEQSSPFRTQTLRSESTFIKALRATVVSTTRKVPITLNQAYYPSVDIKAVLETSVAYVDANLCAQMLDACQVSYSLDAKVLIKRLKQLKTDEAGDTAKALQKIYGRIEDIFDDEKDLIQKSFKDHSLIRVKGPHKSWRKPDEVCWESSGAFLDSICPPLEGQYRDFSKFFERLGVKREIPIERRIDALEKLDTIESLEERRKVALSCYERLSRMLRKSANADESLPSWIQHFRKRALFLDRDGRMVDKDNDLFVDDVPNISKHFAEESDISFLAVPHTALPGLQRFLLAAEVPYLSESHTSDFINAEDGVLDDELTTMVRQCASYFAQILHAKDHDAFEVAQESGLLRALNRLEVCAATEVLVLVSLAGFDRTVSEEIARTQQRIVYRRGARSLKDKIGAQLCSHLGAKPSLAEMFTRVLLEGNSAGIEEFLEEKQIGELPDDSLFSDEISLDGESDDQGSHEEGKEDEVTNEGSQELPSEALNDPSDLVNAAPAVESSLSLTEPEPSNGRLESTRKNDEQEKQANSQNDAPRENRKLANPNADVADIDEQSIGKKDNSKQSEKSNVHPQTSGVGLSEAPSTHAGIQESPHQGRPSTDGSRNAPEKEASRNHQPRKPEEPSIDHFGNPPNRHPKNGGSKGKGKSGNPSRRGTRTGHLMSYVLLKDNDIDEESRDANSEAALEKRRTGSIAVKFFIEHQAARWKSLTEMPELNPGFDVLAVAHDGKEEFIEVKGQSDVWTERGVTLTPRELLEAEKRRDRYWLCVVEYVHDENRRRLYLFQDPFGLTDQFKFDSGWKAAAIAVNEAPMLPDIGRYVEIPGEGRGKIISVTKRGKLSHLHVLLDSGKQKNLVYRPDKMTVSEH